METDCRECGTMFQPKREHARFCCPAHAKAWNNRNISRGGPVIPMLQAWASTRHAAKDTREAAINRYARRELSAMARDYNDQDRAAGRSVIAYVGELMDVRAQFGDRRR